MSELRIFKDLPKGNTFGNGFDTWMFNATWEMEEAFTPKWVTSTHDRVLILCHWEKDNPNANHEDLINQRLCCLLHAWIHSRLGISLTKEPSVKLIHCRC